MSLSNNNNITHNGRIRKEFFKSLELVYAHLRRVSITNHCYNAGIVTLELFQKDVDIKAGLLVQETHLQRSIYAHQIFYYTYFNNYYHTTDGCLSFSLSSPSFFAFLMSGRANKSSTLSVSISTTMSASPFADFCQRAPVHDATFLDNFTQLTFFICFLGLCFRALSIFVAA